MTDPISIPLDAPVFVAGHRGLVGSAIVRLLEQEGFTNLLTPGREELDLRRPDAVDRWFARHRPHYVFLAAGTVGGILANQRRPAEFLYDNLMIHTSVVHAARVHGVTKLLYLGSSCIYPRNCPQPITEEQLLTGPLEPTNEPYAIAKIAGIRLCQAYRRQYGCRFISAMPTNLYGPGDNFDPDDAHVVPALIRRFHEAKIHGVPEVVIWGSGRPRRELMHVEDLARCCLFLMRSYDRTEHVNVGTGRDLTIRELAETIREIVYPEARLVFDASKPDGMPRKRLDVSRITALGWRSRIPLRRGIEETYAWFRAHHPAARDGALAAARSA